MEGSLQGSPAPVVVDAALMADGAVAADLASAVHEGSTQSQIKSTGQGPGQLSAAGGRRETICGRTR